jgi:hypothetical protein
MVPKCRQTRLAASFETRCAAVAPSASRTASKTGGKLVAAPTNPVARGRDASHGT